MTRRIAHILLAVCLAGGPAAALDLRLPATAEPTAERVQAGTDFELPVAPFSDGHVQTRVMTGSVVARAWSFPVGRMTTAQIMDSLRQQVVEVGYAPVLDCADNRCGGFDFRLALDVLPEPDMHVDLGDFRVLTATRGAQPGGPEEAVQVIVSRGPVRAFVQVTQISDTGEVSLSSSTMTTEVAPRVQAMADKGLAERLLAEGHALLPDLVFATGSARLEGERIESLQELADFLKENPDVTVALVGHTDAQGGYGPNLSLSRQRAQAVRSYLIRNFGIAPERLEAEGVSYLAPVASNQTEEGRRQNRRVEVVITSTR